MKNNFKSVTSAPNFPVLEEGVINFWRKDKTFKKSVEERPRDKTFSFYDGPPFATGLPHYGHIVPGTLKDIIPRFKTMQGFRVERRFGWDCHGLPIEYEIEKELKLNGKPDIEKMGVAKFNEACRSVVLRYAKEWEVIVERLGRWVDFKHDYKTMDPTFMESAWWVFKTLYDKKLIYQGYKSMHVCPRCATPLSNFEVTLNYKDKKDTSVYVAFKLKNKKNTFFIALTTTQWTLPGNVLLAVNPKLQYAEVATEGKIYVLLESKIKELMNREKLIMKKINIKDYLGEKYEPLFNVHATDKLKYEVVEADFVSEEDGTGVVHIAPAFGEDDLNLGKKLMSDFIQHVEIDGMVNECFPEGAGIHAFKLSDYVVDQLKENGFLIKKKEIVHSYPHCWRCDTPLLNYATKSWFVKTTEVKERLLVNNDKIHWVPDHIKTGRFGQWLSQVRDWAISRNRYWGTPLPVWECEACKKQIVIGSIADLEKLSGTKLVDLHKQFVDKIIFKCNCGGFYKRINEVFDCWYESGSMPYGSNHYPFENKDKFERNHPADFISEGIDQTRGWFYTLHVLSTALFDKPAFKNCIVHGIVLAEDGQKMSKRKKNYPDPMVIVAKYGADALRFFLMNSTVIKGEDLCFSEKGVGDVVRQIFLPLWNTYSFFQKNSEIDKLQTCAQLNEKTENVLDLWIISRLNKFIKVVTESLGSYDIYEALKPVRPFIEDLSTWYIRRSRKRVGPSAEQNTDKDSFYNTTYVVLATLTKLLAPFTPFFAEVMWQNLGHEDSVHLQEWPKIEENLINEGLEKQMELVRQICELGNAKRKELKIKVRQPLNKIRISNLEYRISNELIQLIKDELNVKNVEFTESKGELSVEYETTITPALKAEGEARDLIRALQDLRKRAGLKLDERIRAQVPNIPDGFEKMIKREVLADELTIGKETKLV